MVPSPKTQDGAAAAQLRRRGFWLEYGSMAWMTAEAAIAITAGVLASSIALAGFGLDSLIEFMGGENGTLVRSPPSSADPRLFLAVARDLEGDIMTAPAAQKWHLQGDWFDSCKCAIPCPCTFAQPPTYGDCDGVLLWHIREGNYGDTVLDGLNVVMLGYFVGNIWTGEAHDGRAAFFFDERADQNQRQALQMIFGGQAGGWPATFAQLIPGMEISGMEFAPIRASFDDKLAAWSVEIPGKASATVEALTGPTAPEGARVQVHNPPGAEVGPGQVATWGRVTSERADAYGFQWERSGNSSKYFPFDWSGPEEA